MTDSEPSVFNKLVFIMDENIRGVQLGVYSVAFVGLSVALRSVRPFSRFKRPSDIPNRFLLNRMKLKGIVEGIEPKEAILMVQHKPLVSLIRSKTELLPVKVSGVNIQGHGVSWLQSVISGNEIMFIPVLKENHCVHCEVTLSQVTEDAQIRDVNVASHLISIGFGTIAPIEKSLSKNKQYLRYYNVLKAAERTALRNKLGIWYYVKPTQEILQKLVSKLLSLKQQKAKVARLAPS